MRKLVFIIALALLTGCEKDFKSLEEIDQLVLFKVEYLNFAWGYQHEGFLIDREGRVLGFDNPTGWNIPSENGIITASDLQENLDKSTNNMGLVQQDNLLREFNRLQGVNQNNLTDPEQQMFDAGTTTYSGYFYDVTTHVYKEVVLRQTGDFYLENRSTGADTIYRWLLSLQQLTRE